MKGRKGKSKGIEKGGKKEEKREKWKRILLTYFTFLWAAIISKIHYHYKSLGKKFNPCKKGRLRGALIYVGVKYINLQVRNNNVYKNKNNRLTERDKITGLHL